MKTAKVALTLIGSAILAFGLCNIHAFASVTEGGVLGLVLLLQYWFGISPAISGLVLNAACFLLGWHTMGRGFLAYSALAVAGFSVFYVIFEPFAPMIPVLISSPLTAAITGAIFVGVGVGVTMWAGGASGGDDALAMSISKMTGVGVQWVYLASDLAVLALSLTYIPLEKILYSLLTVTLSGQIIGWMQKIPVGKWLKV